MQQQRLAAAGGHPVGQLGQVVGANGREAVRLGADILVPLRHNRVQVGQECGAIEEETVQDVLGIEQGKLLEILQHDPLGHRPGTVDDVQVALDVVVVGFQISARQHQVGQQQQPLRHIGAAGDVVALRHVLDILSQLRQTARAETGVQIAVEQEEAVFEAGPGSGHERLLYQTCARRRSFATDCTDYTISGGFLGIVAVIGCEFQPSCLGVSCLRLCARRIPV